MAKQIRKRRPVGVICKDRKMVAKQKIRAGLSALNANESETAIIEAITGIRGVYRSPLWSDVQAVSRAGRLASDSLIALQRVNPTTKFFFVTFTPDVGITSDRQPVAPVYKLERMVRRAISKYGLEAFCVVEVVPVTNYPAGERGRSLLYHVHVIAWTTGDFDPAAVAGALNASSAWHCQLGAPPVTVRTIEDRRALRYAARYLLKPCSVAKRRVPNRHRAGAFVLRDVREDFRGELALRVAEGCSQIELTQIMFGVGREGAAIRQQVRHALEAWHQERILSAPEVQHTPDLWLFWSQVRQTRGSRHYLPYRFDELQLVS